MRRPMPRQMTTLSATGALGHEPIHPRLVLEGIKRPLDFLGADGGSGDSGPYFLGSNQPMNPARVGVFRPGAAARRGPRAQDPADHRVGRRRRHDRGVSDYVEIIQEISAKHKLEPFRLVRIHSEVPLDYLRERVRERGDQAARRGRPTDDGGSRPDQPGRGDDGRRAVFQGVRQGADVVIAGRSCDDAIYASLPLAGRLPEGA